MTKLIKWKQLYKVIFKDEWDVKLITPEQFTSIKQKLFKNEWVEIDNELFNPFEIKKIVKYKTEDWIIWVINQQPQEVQKRVREIMKNYKKNLSVWVVQNMITKVRNDLKLK